MIERDWTLTDQADAADAERDRNWWRRDPWADHFERAEPEEAEEASDDV